MAAVKKNAVKLSNDRVIDMHMENQRSLGRIEETLHHLIGNGQPGIIGRMQNEIDLLMTYKNYVIGAIGLFGILETIMHVLVYLKLK